MTRVTGRQAALSTERQEKGCFIGSYGRQKKKQQLREEKIKVKQDHQ